MANFYYQFQERVVGPVNGIDLREAAFAGKVVNNTLIADEKAMIWVPASHIRGLFDDTGKPLPHPPETQAYLESLRSTQPVAPPLVIEYQPHVGFRSRSNRRRSNPGVWIAIVT